MDYSVIIAAVIAAVPATAASLAALRQSKKASDQLKPSNGTRVAEMVETLKDDMRDVKTDLAYHVTVQHGRGPIEDHRES